MRTTLTLDDDVAGKLRTEMRRSGKSLKETVNEYLRYALNARPHRNAGSPFVVRARPMGSQPGIDYDNIGALLEQIEGPLHR